MNVGVVEFVCGLLTNRADFDLVEIGDLLSAVGKTFQEIVDAVSARKDEPVVTVEMVECFIESIEVVGLANLDGWANYDVCAETFKHCGQIRSLRRRARDDNGTPFERFSHRRSIT